MAQNRIISQCVFVAVFARNCSDGILLKRVPSQAS